jgi:hypothetical protein
MTKMCAERRKQMLNVGSGLIPSRESVNREGMPQIMKTRLVPCILTRDADVFSQPEERIF